MRATFRVAHEDMTLKDLVDFVKTAYAAGAEETANVWPAMESPNDPYTIVGLEIDVEMASTALADFDRIEL